MVDNVLNKEMFYSIPLFGIINGIGLGLHATCQYVQLMLVIVQVQIFRWF